MPQHVLKADPESFKAVADGRKAFEIRRDDRPYAAGDLVVLRETEFSAAQMRQGCPLRYTGAEVCVRITYILRGPAYGLPDGMVVLSLTPVSKDGPRVSVSAKALCKVLEALNGPDSTLKALRATRGRPVGDDPVATLTGELEAALATTAQPPLPSRRYPVWTLKRIK